MNLNEKKLIELMKNKDEKAFNQIYYKYSNLIYFIVYEIIGNKEESEEIVNDVFFTMYNNINQHEMDKSFKYWLITIAKNKAYQYINSQNRRDLINDIHSLPQVEHNFLIDDFPSICKKILTEQEYQIFIYHVIYQIKFTEIGDICHISKSEAHRIYHRAVKKIRDEIKIK